MREYLQILHFILLAGPILLFTRAWKWAQKRRNITYLNWEDFGQEKEISFKFAEITASGKKAEVRYEGYPTTGEAVVAHDELSVPQKRATLSFTARFEEGFEFVKGGKLFGLGPSRHICGGLPSILEGWSVRIMWREDGLASLYIYQQDRPITARHKWGQDFRAEEFKFVPGQTYHVELFVKVNTPGEYDGMAVIYVDSEPVLAVTGLNLRGVGGDHTLINHVLFHTFHGGNTDDWAPATPCKATFTNFRVN